MIGPRKRVTEHDPSRPLVDVFGRRVATRIARTEAMTTLADLWAWIERAPRPLSRSLYRAFNANTMTAVLLWLRGQNRADPGPGSAFLEGLEQWE